MRVRHLYVHMPFCASRCGYCAFVVEVGALDRRDDYLRAVLAELEQERHRLDRLETVYVGGGTPTLMRPRRLLALMEWLRPLLAEGAEVTVEANPETLTGDDMRALLRGGVTRLSFGGQSFQPHLLAALDRGATPDQVRRAVHYARGLGFPSVSMDLLFGIPGQTPGDLEADLEHAIAIEPDHISWYELELKPGSALAARGDVALDQEFAEEAYARIVERLEAAGYRWYETANFAWPGHECRHSLAYWSARDYLGVGVGAFSTMDGVRRRNAPGLERYIRALAAGEAPSRAHELLDEDTRRRERWMLGLRLDRPLDLAWAGPPDRPEAVDRLAKLGLMESRDGTVTLTRGGRFIQNAVLNELMEAW